MSHKNLFLVTRAIMVDTRRREIEMELDSMQMQVDLLLTYIEQTELEHDKELGRVETEVEELKIEHSEELGRVEMERDAVEEECNHLRKQLDGLDVKYKNLDDDFKRLVCDNMHLQKAFREIQKKCLDLFNKNSILDDSH